MDKKRTPRIHRTDKGPNSDTNYVRIDQRVINDMDLSPLARLAMVYILSKPDTWELREHDLRQYLGTGKNLTRRIISELKQAGYIDRRQKRDKETGEWKTITTAVYEIPVKKPLPLPGLRATVNRATGKTEPTRDRCPFTGQPLAGQPLAGQPLAGARQKGGIVTIESETIESVTIDKKGPEQIIFDSFTNNAQPELKMRFPGINWEFAKLSQRNSTLTIALPKLMLERLTPNLNRAQEIAKRNIEPNNITVEFVKDE